MPTSLCLWIRRVYVQRERRRSRACSLSLRERAGVRVVDCEKRCQPSGALMKKTPRPAETTARARQLRRDNTKPEAVLWNVLRGGRLGGLKFRRQHPVGPFFADFYCHSASLVVELDGMSHDDRAQKDERRTEFLQRAGMKVIRILNDNVMSDIEAVARYIAREAGGSLDSHPNVAPPSPHPNPLPEGEGTSLTTCFKPTRTVNKT